MRHDLCLAWTQKHRSACYWLLKKAMLDERNNQGGPTEAVLSSFSTYWQLFLMGTMCLTGPCTESTERSHLHGWFMLSFWQASRDGMLDSCLQCVAIVEAIDATLPEARRRM